MTEYSLEAKAAARTLRERVRGDIESGAYDGLTPVQAEYFHMLEVIASSPAMMRAIQRTKDRISGWNDELATVRQINAALPFAHPIALADDETGS